MNGIRLVELAEPIEEQRMTHQQTHPNTIADTKPDTKPHTKLDINRTSIMEIQLGAADALQLLQSAELVATWGRGS